MTDKIDKLTKHRTNVIEGMKEIQDYMLVDRSGVKSINNFKVRLELLQEHYEAFCKCDKQIQDGGGISILKEVQAMYVEIRAKLQDAIDERTPRRAVNERDLNDTLTDFFRQQSTMFETMRSPGTSDEIAKLPKLNVQPFSGKFSDWPEFQDSFETAIHSNPRVPKLQKFQFLKKLLEGNAFNLVKNIKVTESNYDETWEKLRKRFDNKKGMVNELITRFFNEKPIYNANPNEIRRLADNADEIIRSMKVLGPDAEKKDPWLIALLLKKVDAETRKIWSNDTVDNIFPSIDEFLDFLSQRCISLDTMGTTENQNVKSSSKKSNYKNTISLATTSVDGKISHSKFHQNCQHCNKPHPINKCFQFINSDTKLRKEIVSKHNLCHNCLRPNHSVYNCSSKTNCLICNKRHHTLLHPISLRNELSPSSTDPNIISEKVNDSNITLTIVDSTNLSNSPKQQSILPTALLYVKTSCNKFLRARALLDSGSQHSFITEAFSQSLGLPRRHSCNLISGVGASSAGRTKGKVSLNLHSHQSKDHVIDLEAMIINQITSNLPSTDIYLSYLPQIQDLDLADPSFNKSSKIDILIGIDAFFLLLCDNTIVLNDKVVAKLSKFGWLIAGTSQIEPTNITSLHTTNVSVEDDICNTLRRFWELEEVPSHTTLSSEDQYCIQFYEETTSRDEHGRFIVKLPFKTVLPPLGDSKSSALSRFYSIERKFSRYPTIKRDYTTFMKEYLDLKHMEPIPVQELDCIKTDQSYYLPHHCVYKEDSSTTKIRVVFDGSCKSKTGNSLNDLLLTGPKIQEDLTAILIRFRCHKIVFAADLEKMFRQIRVAKEDTNFQLILWREHTNCDIQTYRLTTVTYGTACAPFLAVQTIKQIGKENYRVFPETSEMIMNDFYVDDILSGTDNVRDAIERATELTQLLSRSGFKIHKWRSNSNEFLSHVLDPEIEKTSKFIQENSIKTLGIIWSPGEDYFIINVPEHNYNLTKRCILSMVSKFFDPLGWISPFIIKMKIFLQSLWLLQLGWDDQIPPKQEKEWRDLISKVHHLKDIRIPRCIMPLSSTSKIELHAFCDASEAAYGAVIYLRMIETSETTVRLVITKSKVAPIKQVSIPRLELCAALLLTKLVKYTLKSLKFKIDNIYAWTDSKIVLCWLSEVPRKWKSFIGNRTSEILHTLPRQHWHHVPTKLNPADFISRGVDPRILVSLDMYWNGPLFLTQQQSNWPKQSLNDIDTTFELEARSHISLTIQKQECIISNLISRCSSWLKIKLIIAYIFKFFSLLKQEEGSRSPIAPNNLQRAEKVIIRTIQNSSFYFEINLIKEGKNLSSSSILSTLYPFIDNDNIMRVGGRLQNSVLPYDAKHPIIIPKGHPIVKLIIQEYHLKNLHAGFTLTHNSIRQKFWIINSRTEIKKYIKGCVTCARYKFKYANQLMGSLPYPRVTKNRPFLISGVDLAGPINIKASNLRKSPLTKAYLIIFVCMSVKAVHIEVVSDMSSEAFLSALRRFISRRGIPAEIWCDNGRNFVGGNAELKFLYSQFKLQLENKLIYDFSLQNTITFKFIPPTASHFGGLWEAAVKSAKYHLKRVMKDANLTFEAITTLVIQIEAILNSRPLYTPPLNDPTHSLVMTPAHFLIGDVLTSLPEPTNIEICSKHSIWRNIQARQQSFWKSWSEDYLCGLQQRHKWKHPKENIVPGDIVAIKGENLPPSRWALAKVEEIHPGKDGFVRVATVKTANAICKRPISKLCRLPGCPRDLN